MIKFIETLKNYKNSDSLRFHMPGHAGKNFSGKAFSTLLDGIYPYDVTELPFTDDLHDPDEDGVFAEIESYLKEVTSAKDVILSCAGSTSMIQTAVTAALRRKHTKILCQRRVHLSVVHAIALNRGDAVWLNDAENIEIELSGKITGEESCVIVTSPDYYGNILDIVKISEICKKFNVPLIVDSAHGAHLEFYKNGELSAFRNGASLCVESLHKTLPSLTGAAVLLSDGMFTKDELLYARRKFSSSSPSYLISLSIAECFNFMELYGDEKLRNLAENVREAKKSLKNLGFNMSVESRISDPFRICIKTGEVISAAELNEILVQEKIICEFYEAGRIVLIPSLLHEKKDFEKLISVCESAVKNHKKGDCQTELNFSSYSLKRLPEKRMTMGEAFSYPFKKMNIDDSLSKVCAEPVYLYPPGIPVIMPGEIFDADYIEYLKNIGITEVNAVADAG